MTLSNVSLYELRQYLSILLWIALPLIIVTLSVTAILHNLRKKRRSVEQAEQEAYPDMSTGIDFLAQTSTDTNTEQTAYKGIIWLRTKYQQDMEKADHKIHILSEECRQLEKKVEDLLSASPDQSSNKNKVIPENNGAAAHADVAVKIQDTEISSGEKQQIAGLQEELARLREDNAKLQREMKERMQSAAEENITRIRELEEELSRQSLEHAKENEVMHAKLMHAENFENEIQDLKDQHLQEKTTLRETLDAEIKRSKDLHKKLELSSGLLQKIVKEINTTAFETPRISYKEGHPPAFNKIPAEEKRPKISAWTESSLGEEN